MVLNTGPLDWDSSTLTTGPLHFTKDTQTFKQFVLEIQVCNPETRGIKKIGVDMEDAIYNGVKILLPEAQQLYCVQHLKQQDEM